MHTYFKCIPKALLGCCVCRSVCRSVSGRHLRGYTAPAHAQTLSTLGVHTGRGTGVPLNAPPQGAGSCHPLAEAAPTSPRTPQAQQPLWEPHKPRLSPQVPLSLAGPRLGLLGVTATFSPPLLL